MAASTSPRCRPSSRSTPTSPWSRSPTTSAGPFPAPTGKGPFITACPGTCTPSATGPEGYLAFLGRISPEKRLDRAIEIARRSGRRLKIAAKLYPEEDDYYKQTIEPLLLEARSFVEFVGEVGGREKDEFLGNADALLFPIDWPEPFGLVMIEALACGTPVIAWREGSVPEVIEEGVTGFIVENIDEAVAAVGRVQWLDRRECRQAFEARFDAARMAEDYVAIYRRLAGKALEPAGGDSHLLAPRRRADRMADGTNGPPCIRPCSGPCPLYNVTRPLAGRATRLTITLKGKRAGRSR